MDEKTRKENRKTRKRAIEQDRSKYKKTDLGKWEKQQKEEMQKKLSSRNLHRGRVLAIHPESIAVEYAGKVYSCVLRGLLKREARRMKNLVTVGDFVLFSEGVIALVEERRSFLARKEHLGGRKQQLIAANIDQVLITVSVADPPLKPSLIDRYIIAAYKGKMEPILVINKMDLLEEHPEERRLVLAFIELYRSLGLTVMGISAYTGEGMGALREQMRGKASVFSGQSGTGKSSIINELTGLDFMTGTIVKRTRKGAHTTTAAQLIPLAFGGWCIDTPGIRSFGVWDLTLEDLHAYFPEIEEEGRGCRYPNCSHSHEPECAVRQGVERGTISPLRYDSYLKLLDEEHD